LWLATRHVACSSRHTCPLSAPAPALPCEQPASPRRFFDAFSRLLTPVTLPHLFTPFSRFISHATPALRDTECSLHYNENNQRLENNWVLMDAGGVYYGYGTDITRTWPRDGTFSKTQSTMYPLPLPLSPSPFALLCPPPLLPCTASRLRPHLQSRCVVPASSSPRTLVHTRRHECLFYSAHNTAPFHTGRPSVL